MAYGREAKGASVLDLRSPPTPAMATFGLMQNPVQKAGAAHFEPADRRRPTVRSVRKPSISSLSHGRWMPLAVIDDEPLDPVRVALLGGLSQVLSPGSIED